MLPFAAHRCPSIKTEVSRTDGVMTIGGVASNAAENGLVAKLANNIIGVDSVVNNMTTEVASASNNQNPHFYRVWRGSAAVGSYSKCWLARESTPASTRSSAGTSGIGSEMVINSLLIHAPLLR